MGNYFISLPDMVMVIGTQSSPPAVFFPVATEHNTYDMKVWWRANGGPRHGRGQMFSSRCAAPQKHSLCQREYSWFLCQIQKSCRLKTGNWSSPFATMQTCWWKLSWNCRHWKVLPFLVCCSFQVFMLLLIPCAKVYFSAFVAKEPLLRVIWLFCFSMS